MQRLVGAEGAEKGLTAEWEVERSIYGSRNIIVQEGDRKNGRAKG